MQASYVSFLQTCSPFLFCYYCNYEEHRWGNQETHSYHMQVVIDLSWHFTKLQALRIQLCPTEMSGGTVRDALSCCQYCRRPESRKQLHTLKQSKLERNTGPCANLTWFRLRQYSITQTLPHKRFVYLNLIMFRWWLALNMHSFLISFQSGIL